MVTATKTNQGLTSSDIWALEQLLIKANKEQLKAINVQVVKRYNQIQKDEVRS